MNKTAKHLIPAALLSLLFVAGLSSTVSRADIIGDYKVSKIYVTNDADKSATIESYLGKDENVVIPEYIGDYHITEISPFAFRNKKDIKSVKIPDSVTVIGNSVFNGCESLTDISIPAGLKYTGVNAFEDTPFYKNDTRDYVIYGDFLYRYKGTDGKVVIPDGVKKVNSAVVGIGLLESITEVTIPDSVTYMAFRTFEQCINLKKLTLSKNCKDIYSLSFDNCKSLETLVIPEGVVNMSSGAFGHCTSLKTVYLPSTLEDGQFAFNFSDKIKDVYYGGTMKQWFATKRYDLVFRYASEPLMHYSASPASVTEGETKDTEVTVNGAKFKISGKEATFISTSKKGKVTVPDKIKVNGKSLKVTVIAAGAFSGRKDISSVTVGKNVRVIGKNAFKKCKKLKTVTVKSENITTVGANAFKGCSKKLVVKVPKKTLKKYKKIFPKKIILEA